MRESGCPFESRREGSIVKSEEVPDPKVRPVVSLWPETAGWMELGRSAVYQAAERGEIPTLKVGRRVLVPTAALRKLLKLDDELEGAS